MYLNGHWRFIVNEISAVLQAQGKTKNPISNVGWKARAMIGFR
jgi:hypothetical protein